MAPNKALVMAKHPLGFPVAGEDLVVTETTLDLSSAAPAGGLILKTNSISYDPYLRGKMRPNVNSYVPSLKPGELLDNNAISTVLKSDNPRFREGDVVIGTSNFQEYVTIPKERADKDQAAGGFSILENPLGLDPQLFLGPLGMSGLTAYSSLYEIGKPKRGETIFISAASGAVGQIVGQLAKHEGLKVLGSVGSDEKLRFIKDDLGFDDGFNYKTEKPEDALKRLLASVGSSGLDIYYDNVGGEQLDACILSMNNFGRIGKVPVSMEMNTRVLILGSCMRKRFSVKQEARGNTQHCELSTGSWKAACYQGLHRHRPRYGAKIQRRTPKECAEVDQGRYLQGQTQRDGGHRQGSGRLDRHAEGR